MPDMSLKNKFPLVTLVFILVAFSPDKILSQYLPDGAEQWYFNTEDNVRHYVVELGHSGDPDKTFIVLHGGYGAEHSYLIDMVEPLTDRYRFVLYDQRGSLRTPAPGSTITFEGLVGDLDKLREELGLEDVRLIGHSNGAVLALDYMTTYPERVSGLVFLGAPLSFLHEEFFDEEELDGFLQTHQKLSEELNEKQEAQIIEKLKELELYEEKEPGVRTAKENTYRWRVNFAGRNIYHIDRWNEFRGGMIYFNPDVFSALRDNHEDEEWNNRNYDISEAFVSHDIPTRVIIGEYDFVDPKGTVWGHIVNKAPDAKLYLLPEAAHNAWIDQPEEFTRQLMQAMDEVTGN
jgi:proline iminopeptidase